MSKKKKKGKRKRRGPQADAIVSAVFGKNTPPQGITPAVALWNPKYAHNVGAVLRACSCFGVKQLWFSGDRVKIDVEGKTRLPREERWKGYRDVELRQFDQFFEQFPDAVPVAIEITDNAELLPAFEHPDNAFYVFGPEDGGLPSVAMRHCHRRVAIPTSFCTNLAAAVYIVLYDRLVTRINDGREELKPLSDYLKEHRGWLGTDDPADKGAFPGLTS
jgi:tRNA(Leu) C34 or U34 (ribose-2'-O)-methylase TrmL